MNSFSNLKGLMFYLDGYSFHLKELGGQLLNDS